MNYLKYLHIVFCGILLLSGCHKSPESDLPTPDAGTISVRFIPEEPTTRSFTLSKTAQGETNDQAIGQVIGYRFTQGLFRETIVGEPSGTDGVYTFHPSSRLGEIYFIANGPSEMSSELQPDVSTQEEFLELYATAEEMTASRFTMTGKASLDELTSTPATIRLRRTVARIDLVVQERGVAVHEVTIRGIADRGYLNERNNVSNPAASESTDFLKEYTDTPLTNSRETLLYLCEQTGDALSVEVIADINGGLHRMTATFPSEILRNRIYTIQVHGNGASASLSVVADNWEEGDSTESAPDLKGVIDVEASALPESVRINSSCDSVYVPYQGAEFRLVLRAEAESDVAIEGIARGVTTQVETLTKSLQPVAAVSVTSDRRLPGEKQAYLYLNLHRDGLCSGRIVLVFEPNPVVITGAITFDENGICDFGKYVDGELGRMKLPEGKTARLAFDSGEDAWMKLVDDQGELRILGGWKPNDPKADGRTQEGRIIIADADGSNSESYSLRRRNWGLPVVEIDGTWWCKYNLRGSVKKFEDQISIQADPASDRELADYLNTCDEDELLRLMGDQYQGGTQQGLRLGYDGTAFLYEGMHSSGGNFGTLDPTLMAPDGYQIPDYDDYAFFSANNNFNLGGVGSRSYKNAAGQEITVRIIERDVTFLGQHYGNVSFYEFQTETGYWVLYGLGHQWNTTPGNISTKMLLLATYGNSANCWVMEGYAQSDRPNQNWLKFMNQNSTKTQTIRCIKSPVEYIY